MSLIRVWLPLVLLLSIAVIFVFGLKNDPSYIPSVRIDKKAPGFSLQTLEQAINKSDDSKISPKNWEGKIWILNVFASWCVACNIEHPILMKLANENSNIKIIGLAYKDNPDKTKEWLRKNGNPYDMVLVDLNGNVGIDYGVYGVPETFIIDSVGMIRYKNVGPIQPTFYEDHLLPFINN